MITTNDINSIIDHATSLVMAVGAVVGGIITVVKLLHNNKELSKAATDSVPGHTVNKMLDQAAVGTTVNVDAAPADVTVNTSDKENAEAPQSASPPAD